MRKFKLLLFFFTLFSLTSVFAQNGKITGVIVDRSNSEKIPFANIVGLLKNSSSPIRGAISDIQGKFIIDNLSSGVYNIVISFIGYQTDTIRDVNINSQKQQVDLGEIRLNVITVSLGEVEVKDNSGTMTSKLDMITYKVQDFETAKGGNASDVLNKLPSVSIDQEGVISVRGTSDFLVYYNGKPSRIETDQLLAQIPAANIESIDIITVPTAKYDAQGKGGIINITTKKTAEEGLSVSSGVLTGGAPWGNYTQHLSNKKMNDNRLGGLVNLIYSKNRLSFYGSLNLNSKNVNGTRPGSARLLQENGSYYNMVSDGARPEWYKNFTANGIIDYKLNNGSVISASYFFGNRNEGRSAFYNYHTFYSDENKNPIIGIPVNDQWIYNPNKRNRYGIFHTVNIDFIPKLKNSSGLKISALFEHSDLLREMENFRYQSTSLFDVMGDIESDYRQTDHTPLNGYRLSVDYSKVFKNGNTLDLGIQPQYLETSGTFSFDTLNILNNTWGDYNYFENAIDFRRGIFAGYADYSGVFGKFEFITGIRLEYADQLLNIMNPDYFTIFDRIRKPKYEMKKLDWFPSIHLNYNITGNSNLTLASSRRISRPPLNNMAPFLYREHYEVYVVGDPALEPEYISSFELGFNKKSGKNSLRLTGFYRATDNAVFRVNTVYEKENVLIRSYTNSANTRSTGLEMALNFETGTLAKFSVSSSVYNFKVEGDIFGYSEYNRSTNWTLKVNANFIITGYLKFTTDFDLKSATVTAQGKDEMIYLANASLNFAPKRMPGWDFTLKALDFLKSNHTALNTHAFNANGTQIFYQEVAYDRYGPIVELNVSYAFNMKGKSAKKTDSSFGKEQF